MLYKIKLYKANILSGLGYVNYLNFDYKKAIFLLEESMKLKETIHQLKDEKYLLKYLSLCYFNLGDYESAIEYLYGALEKINKNPDSNIDNDNILKSEIYYSLGKNYYRLERYDKALEFYLKSIEYCKQLKYNAMLVLAYNGIAETYISLNDYKKAEKHLLDSKRIALNNNNNLVSDTYAILARVKLEYNDVDSASFYLSKAEDIALKNNDKLALITIYKNYTLLHIKNKNLYEAAFYAKKYLEIGKIKKDFTIITDANKLLYQIYEAKGEYLRAFEYLKEYNNYRDSLSIEEAQNIVLKHELQLQQQQQFFQDSLKFQAFKKQKEDELNIHKIKSEKSDNEKKMLYVGVFILLLMLFIFIRSIIQKKKDNQLISIKAKEIEKQSKLLENQNEKLKTDAILYQILNICSSDVSLNTILKSVLTKLINSDVIGTNSKGFISLNENNELWKINVSIGLTKEEIEKIKKSPFSNCICGKKYTELNVEFCQETNDRHFNVPILNNNEFLGVLIVYTDFDLDKMIQLKDFFKSVGILLGQTIFRSKISDKLRLAHIENTIKKKEIQRAHQSVNKSLIQQEAINGLMNAIIRNENVGDKIYKYVSEILGNAFIRRLNITLFDFEKEMVRFYFLRENGVEKIDNKDFPLSNISKETLERLKQNEKVIINSIKDRKEKSESDLQMLRNNINAFASFPLFMENKLIGDMNLSFEDEINLSTEQEKFMQMLLEGVTIAIHQNLLFNEITEKNILLSDLHQEISSSINYARSLQKSILPSPEYVDDIFDDKFILLKQRDVVGGDFYWVRQYDNYRMIACIDCTGHSVPGAFMTMLSRVLLREAATIKQLKRPDLIIAQMDHAVKRILRQNNYDAMQDGMDMSVAIINDNTKEICFSSAQRPIVIKFKNKEELQVIKGSRFPVGGYYEIEKKYDLHQFKLDEIDSFYLFSDGYTDQFGGDKVKKYGFKRFLKSLNIINGLPMNQQKDFILNEFNNWKGKLDQIDDVCVIGVRL